MKALFLNGSPRKNWNTFKLLEQAMKGAQDAGAETELIYLFSYEFTGCKSCFACKLKNAKTNGLCAVHDKLRPILEKAFEADVIVIGSPVYFSYPTGQVRSFIERLLFPIMTYMIDENGEHKTLPHKPVKTAMIYTMNCPKDWMEKFNYPTILGETANNLKAVFGHCEWLYSCDTYQFSDYNRYDCNMFTEEHKSKQREEQFPIDLQNAYNLGKRLASVNDE